jgi:hypothetical protein
VRFSSLPVKSVGVMGDGRRLVSASTGRHVQADSFNGIDHGVAVFIIRAAIQYHAMRVEPFMVFVKEPFPHRVGLLQAHAFVR